MTQNESSGDIGPRFCSNCSGPISSGDKVCGRCGQTVTQRQAQDAGQGLYVPVRLTIPYEYVESLSSEQLVTIRLLLFVKWLFAIPLFLFGVLYGVASLVAVFFAFWAILFTGRFPEGLFAFVRGYVQYEYKIWAYFPLLLTNHWAPDEQHPVQLTIDYPESCSRLVLLFLKLPSFLLGLVSNLVGISFLTLFLWSIPAWWLILITGRYPQSWFSLTIPLLEWNCRVTVWQNLMRDEASLFGTTTPVKVMVAVVVAVSLVVGFGICPVAF